MRLGAGWSAIAFALLAVTVALSTSQANYSSRRKKLPSTTSEISNADSLDQQKIHPTFKPRNSRRNYDSTPPTARDVTRTRGRRPTEPPKVTNLQEKNENNLNERPDVRKISSRTRNRSIESRASGNNSQDFVFGSQTRFPSRSSRNSSTKMPGLASSIKSDIEYERQSGVILNSTPKNDGSTTQFRRRSFISQTTEREIIPTSIKNRYISRNNARSMDLLDTGTTNSVGKSSTTIKSSEASRNSKKLRYRTRFSETDTNLTGEGLTPLKDIPSSQIIDNTTSQAIAQNYESATVSNAENHTSSTVNNSTIMSRIVVRRPISRKPVHYKPSDSTVARNLTDDINEDDNYPESFKALLQAKSASTQTSSPSSESLSVKASQTDNTHSTSSQTTYIDPDTKKYSRLQKKAEETKDFLTTGNLSSTIKSSNIENKRRVTFAPRGRKSTPPLYALKQDPLDENVRSTDKPLYKYSRKVKFSTTPLPKTIQKSKIKDSESESNWKKSANKPTYFSKRKSNRVKAENSTSDSNIISSSSEQPSKVSRALYSRYSRNHRTSTTSSSTTEQISTHENRKENATDSMPFLISLLSSTERGDSSTSTETASKSMENTNDIFIIAVTSKESQENNIQVDNQIKQEEQGIKPFVGSFVTTSKYHSNYKNEPITISTDIPTVSHTIRNIQSRFTPSPETTAEQSKLKTKGRYFRKYSDTFSKTTDMTTNGMTAESEKPRGRFSSKFRATNDEKPYYKPTVPTVTPSTAWLKFFVTDNLLTKTVEEPIWFDEADFYTTEPMPREFITSPPYIHEPSLQLVEGEEIELGSDTKAFSITQSRRTLTSADLRLSESLEKSHVMNVEASNHSPSVTVSIFDALADILTSTPQTRLSSTTEVTQNPNNNIDVKESLIDVSSISVNTGRGLTTQDLKPDTLSVQTTVDVINNLSIGTENPDPFISKQIKTIPSPDPIPPTPLNASIVTARRPFAIKILYSNTENPTDIYTTTTDPSREQLSTSSPVINTVSDILISNSNSVSVELTSMLTNNINDILQNMNAQDRTKLTEDMAKILQILIPKTMNQVKTIDEDDADSNTTPYTLEDIKDTENIDLESEISFNDNLVLQSASSGVLVNSSGEEEGSLANRFGETVDTTVSTVGNINNYLLNGQLVTTDLSNDLDLTTLKSTTLGFNSKNISTFSMFDSILANSSKGVKKGSNLTQNNILPLPFFTNSQVDDFSSNDSLTIDSDNMILLPLTKSAEIFTQQPLDITTTKNNKNTVQISPIQLLILSKKAEVLFMIEELIKRHNDEINNISLAKELTPTNDVLLSKRLTEIMLQINQSTIDDSNNYSLVNKLEPQNFTSSTPSVSTFPPDDNPVTGKLEPLNLTTSTPPLSTFPLDDNPTTVKQQEKLEVNLNDLKSFHIVSTTFIPLPSLEDNPTFNENPTTESIEEKIRDQNQLLGTSNTESVQTTTENTITTTDVLDSSVTVNLLSSLFDNQETTTESQIRQVEDSTDIANTESIADIIETTTTSSTESVFQTINTTSVNGQTYLNTQTAIPKKDFVIFGILPNNTVVRKDPNENTLESLTEASPYIIYGVLPNNTVIRKFPNGTRVPRIMQKVDIIPISPWSLRNPYSPIHNNPAIVRPKSNPIQIVTNSESSSDNFNNGTEPKLTSDTVNNLQDMIPPSTFYINDSSSFDVTTGTNKSPAEKSTASHVLNLRTSTMLPSVDEILLNSISSAVKKEMVISEMSTSTPVPRILTLDIDPETKMIRTEKPGDGNESTIFKFIPVDEVSIAPGDSNVLKIVSTKAPLTSTTMMSSQTTITDSQTTEYFSTTPITTTTEETRPVFTNVPRTTEYEFSDITSSPLEGEVTSTIFDSNTITTPTSTSVPITLTTEPIVYTSVTFTPEKTTTAKLNVIPTNAKEISNNTFSSTEYYTPSTTFVSAIKSDEESQNYENDAKYLTELFKDTTELPKNINISTRTKKTENLSTQSSSTNVKINKDEQLIKALLSGVSNNVGTSTLVTNTFSDTTSRTIDEELKQLEEDTKLLKALLQATGQNSDNILPQLFNTKTTPKPKQTTTVSYLTTSMTESIPTSTLSDSNLIQSILKAAVTVQDKNEANLPIITGDTSHIRFSSNSQSTTSKSNPETSFNGLSVYTTTETSSPLPSSIPTISSRGSPIFLNTLQSETTTEDVGISTTYVPINQKITTSQRNAYTRRKPTTTTEMPSTSTFSVQEDLLFLKNLKTALKTNSKNEDPETALANRIIALAVEKSLNEIETGKQTVRTGKTISENSLNSIITTTPITTTTKTTTTTTTTTTTPQTTTTNAESLSTPTLEEDLKQFQEDTKLLQALIKATGQDPSKFNIPTLPSIITTTNVSSTSPITFQKSNLKLAFTPSLPSASPAHIRITSASTRQQTQTLAPISKPFGARIAVKANLKTLQDDANLLKTLVTLQGAQETTTQLNKIALTGQSTDEALNNLIKQKRPAVMMSSATKSPISLSTEYGKSKDALLAALLKEQGFGPTTASSLVEQQRLSALLNQVVVTPKSRKPMTPPPPPPPPTPRRPVLDGLAWLWQQWRETGPGPGGSTGRIPGSTATTAPASGGANWFGSGPFVGNADDRPSSNRVPLEPPRAVTSEQGPGRGQLVSAAINVTRAFSQFLGAAIQGAAQTMQSVFRAGQRVTSQAYTNGSGGSG